MQNNTLLYLALLSLIMGMSSCKNSTQTSQTEVLLQAYLNTDYQVYPTPSQTLHIRINQHNTELDQFLKGHQYWAYITAWNPNSKALPAAENEQRNQALVKELAAKGFTYYPGKGVPNEGDWIPEASFLILDLSKNDALQIGRKYGQKAIVWGQVGSQAGLFFCMPD